MGYGIRPNRRSRCATGARVVAVVDRVRRAAAGARHDVDHGTRWRATPHLGDGVPARRFPGPQPRLGRDLLGRRRDWERRTMNVTLWGTRGSLPTPGPATERYGGNTSCVEVRGQAAGHVVVLD